MPTVLVVEDNARERANLARRLRRRGFRVVTAADGAAGVTKATSERPDVVLMDLNMPVMGGCEAACRLRAEPRTAFVPIVALSGQPLDGDRERALEAGCSAFHTKAVPFAVLLAEVEALLLLAESAAAGMR